MESEGLCSSDDRILLAVSGGIDSVVMAHLFRQAGVNGAIAHCNFQLRGEDSQQDVSFTKELAGSLGYTFFSKEFEVEEVAEDRKISIQMAARELRYQWFGELLEEHGFDCMATAHTMNDSVETFMLNLSRGTGIRGLSGIPVSTGKVIRPLLFATRTEIEAYADREGIRYREDASNRETKYRRNKIRHDVIPVMEQINPAFIQTMSGNMERLQEALTIFRQAVELTRRDLFSTESGQICINIQSLKALTPKDTWLYELFSPYGFNRMQCEGIGQILDSDSGKRSISPTHQLFKDRDRLILTTSDPGGFDRYYLDSPENVSSLPFPMDIEVMDREELDPIPTEPDTACLDLDLVQFPLTLRHWIHGDYFFPLGMEGIKKLSDFFVDRKIPVPEKERIWILASGKKIVWILGLRIDHRFRITEKTRRVLILRLHTDIAP